jgi:RNA polymerase sigma factor (sigma-70 family)
MGKPRLAAVVGHIRRIASTARDSELSDRQLLEHFAAGKDEEAFACLVKRHGGLVFGVCRRVLQHIEDADDAFQATFLVLARKASAISWRESVSNWLYETAYRSAIEIRVKACRQRAHERQAASMPKRATMAEEMRRELASVLDEEVQRLPTKFRQPFLLCFLEGQTRDQAAKQLGWSLRTVERRLAEGRERLRARLSRRGWELPAVLVTAGIWQDAAKAALSAARISTTARAAAAVLSPQVATLADKGLKSICVARPKTATALLVLALAVGGSGAGILAYQDLRINPAPATGENPLQAAAKDLSPAQPEQEPETRTDLYGDRLPPGAVTRLGTDRYRVPGGWAFDAAGKTFVSGTDTGLLLREVPTGKVLRRFGTPGAVYAGAISPDGSTVASAGGPLEHVVRIWDVLTGRELWQFNCESGSYGQILLFAPDGKKLARDSSNGTTRLWDLVTGKEIWKRGRFDDQGVPFSPEAFLPDGKTLIGRENHEALVLVDVATGRELRRFTGPPRQSTLVFSQDRKILATRGQGWVIQLWDVTIGKQMREILGLRSTGEHFAFSPDGKTLAWSSEDKTIRLLDVATGQELRRVAKGLETANVLTFLRDNRTLAFRLWNESTVRVWDLERDCELYPLAGHRGRVFAALYTPDSRNMISASMDNSIRYWDLASGKEVHTADAHRGGVWCLALTADGKTLASGSLNEKDHDILLWDAATRKETGRLPLKEGAQALAFSTNGKMLLTASPGPDENRLDPEHRDYALRLWDVAAGKELRRWEARSAHCPVALSSDDRFVASESDRSILVWATDTGRAHRQLPLPTPVSLNDLAFSPDGRTLVSAQRDGRYKNPVSAIRFWELASGKERLSVKLAPAWGKCLSFSPDGKYLAVGGAEHNVYLLDVGTGAVIRHFEGHYSDLTTLAFAPDGKSLASGSADTTILIWQVDALPRGDRNGTANIPPQQLRTLWNNLAGADAPQAYRAIVTMGAAPRAVAYLSEQLKPAAAADLARLARYIANLDSQQFSIREKAVEELARLGELAEPALRQALATQPSLELRRRVDMLLRKLEGPVVDPEALRSLRALEVLEHIDTRAARELLSKLAAGAPASSLTQGAQAAIQRLAGRAAANH